MHLELCFLDLLLLSKSNSKISTVFNDHNYEIFAVFDTNSIIEFGTDVEDDIDFDDEINDSNIVFGKE